METKDQSEINERVYTAKDRKAKGTFFGDPKNEKFPIKDRAHYSLALQMLGRASYPGFNKSAVRARILAYGKKMGYAKDDAQAEEFAAAAELVGSFMQESLSEAMAAKTKGGKTLLHAIMHEANHISSHASTLHDYGSGYNSYGNDPMASDPMSSCTESTGAMYESASRLKRMTRMMHEAEKLPMSEPPAAPPAGNTALGDGTYEAEDIEYDENLILESDTSGAAVTVAFTEAGSVSGPVKGIIKGRMIAAGFNKAKTRYYDPVALKEAVDNKMWVGKHMFLDHATDAESRQRPEGSVRNMAAIIKETWINKDGSIGYQAQVSDPVFETRLAYMQEKGILGSVGVSIRASGQGKPDKIEGYDTFRVEHFVEAYSTDVVTLPGAYGSIDLLESLRESPADENGANDMDEKSVAALMDNIGKMLDEKLKPIRKSQESLDTRMETVEVKGKVNAMIEATELPDAAKANLRESLAEVIDVAEAEKTIKNMVTLCEALAPKVEKKEPEVRKVGETHKLGANPVEGMGATTGAEKKLRGPKDLLESPAVALFGGKEKAEKLMESMR